MIEIQDRFRILEMIDGYWYRTGRWPSFTCNPASLRGLTMSNTINTDIAAQRSAAIAARQAPDVGDFILFHDGSMKRITYAWPDGYQTTKGQDGGSFYLGRCGHVDYSGTLEPSVYGTFAKAGFRDGRCWFFDRDWPRADGGINVTIPFNVWRIL